MMYCPAFQVRVDVEVGLLRLKEKRDIVGVMGVWERRVAVCRMTVATEVDLLGCSSDKKRTRGLYGLRPESADVGLLAMNGRPRFMNLWSDIRILITRFERGRSAAASAPMWMDVVPVM